MHNDNFGTATSRAATVDAFMKAFETNGYKTLIMVTSPHKYTVPSGVAGETSVHPSWRKSLWSVLLYDFWAWDMGLPGSVELYHNLNDATDPLRAITPGGGVYGVSPFAPLTKIYAYRTFQNEAHIWEPEWQAAYASSLLFFLVYSH